ncbi:MAG TPA: LPS assembly protein LptD, partial [Burkholderiales bacterium]|nr:LPS assembly protein LptD [Burkholderiales bacterium]
DQNNLPNFDSAPMDFTYAQMFTENQFSGNDRFSDANQVTLALTSRFIEGATGNERLRMTLAERIYLQSPKLIPVTTSTSDMIASVGGALTNKVSFDSYIQYDPRSWKTQFISMYAHYHPAFGKLLNLGYLYNRTILPLSSYAYGTPNTYALTNVLPAAVLAQGYALNQVDIRPMAIDGEVAWRGQMELFPCQQAASRGHGWSGIRFRLLGIAHRHEAFRHRVPGNRQRIFRTARTRRFGQDRIRSNRSAQDEHSRFHEDQYPARLRLILPFSPRPRR